MARGPTILFQSSFCVIIASCSGHWCRNCLVIFIQGTGFGIVPASVSSASCVFVLSVFCFSVSSSGMYSSSSVLFVCVYFGCILSFTLIMHVFLCLCLLIRHPLTLLIVLHTASLMHFLWLLLGIFNGSLLACSLALFGSLLWL